MDDFDKIIRGDGKPEKGGLFYKPKHAKKRDKQSKGNLQIAAGDALQIADSMLKLAGIHKGAMEDYKKEMDAEMANLFPDVVVLQRLRCDFQEEEKRFYGCLREHKRYMREHKWLRIKAWFARG